MPCCIESGGACAYTPKRIAQEPKSKSELGYDDISLYFEQMTKIWFNLRLTAGWPVWVKTVSYAY